MVATKSNGSLTMQGNNFASERYSFDYFTLNAITLLQSTLIHNDVHDMFDNGPPSLMGFEVTKVFSDHSYPRA